MIVSVLLILAASYILFGYGYYLGKATAYDQCIADLDELLGRAEQS